MSLVANIPPFAQGVFTTDTDGATRLVGSVCPECGRHAFPAVSHCADDGTPTDPADLGGDATLYSYTVVRTKPPFGLPTPYAVGYADLDVGGLRIFMLLDPERTEDFRIGMRLRLAEGAIGVNLDGDPCRRPFFSPATIGG